MNACISRWHKMSGKSICGDLWWFVIKFSGHQSPQNFVVICDRKIHFAEVFCFVELVNLHFDDGAVVSKLTTLADASCHHKIVFRTLNWILSSADPSRCILYKSCGSIKITQKMAGDYVVHQSAVLGIFLNKTTWQ